MVYWYDSIADSRGSAVSGGKCPDDASFRVRLPEEETEGVGGPRLGKFGIDQMAVRVRAVLSRHHLIN